MAPSIGLVDSRLTILDRFAVSADQLYRYSAVRDFLPTFRALAGVKAPAAAGVRGISPGYLAIGEQADPENPSGIIVDEAGHVRPLAGAAGAGLAPLKFLPGTVNTTPENGAFEWPGATAAPQFVFNGARKTFAFVEDLGGGTFVNLQGSLPGTPQVGSVSLTGGVQARYRSGLSGPYYLTVMTGSYVQSSNEFDAAAVTMSATIGSGGNLWATSPDGTKEVRIAASDFGATLSINSVGIIGPQNGAISNPTTDAGSLQTAVIAILEHLRGTANGGAQIAT